MNAPLISIARALGGEVVGQQVLCPGPNHSPRDRSLSVRLSPNAPEGFIAFSHAGDDFKACRDHIKKRIRLPASAPKQKGPVSADDIKRSTRAVDVWEEARDLRGTVVEAYLTRPKLEGG